MKWKWMNLTQHNDQRSAQYSSEESFTLISVGSVARSFANDPPTLLDLPWTNNKETRSHVLQSKKKASKDNP